MGDTIKINKLIIETGGNEYEMDAGGGGGQLGPNTVGTEQIIDGAVEEQDLHDDVKDRMTVTYDNEDEGIKLGGYAKPGDLPADTTQVSTQPTTPTQPMIVEEEEEP